MARILVTGVNGQVGTYLAEMLVAEGHEVLGVARSAECVVPGVRMIDLPLTAATAKSVVAAADALDAIVHLAGRSSVARSWPIPLETFELHAHLTAALTSALIDAKSTVRFVNASSAEIFGRGEDRLLHEGSRIAPVSPYGAAKAAAHFNVQVAREGYGLRASNLVFFPGESERRGAQFVFRKITQGIAAIKLGQAKLLELGNTSVVRDFSHASDFASAAKLLALGGTPGDYCVATGVGHTIQEVAERACALLGLDAAKCVRSEASLVRPTDIPSLVGDSTKLRGLGWAPTLDFDQLVSTILNHDLAQLRAQSASNAGTQ